jgi:hypothetical protein
MNGTSKGRISLKSWPSRSTSTSAKPESGGVAPVEVVGVCAPEGTARQPARKRAAQAILPGNLGIKVRFKPPPADHLLD